MFIYIELLLYTVAIRFCFSVPTSSSSTNNISFLFKNWIYENSLNVNYYAITMVSHSI